ncbi:hypothetical protein K492DRAFT_199566 [Lichtheimia hyalospora FSU 10163]|nr:hypothetical protein K492DRAFT_199566 [Lichtheimia hyalospora FSU 10163]
MNTLSSSTNTDEQDSICIDLIATLPTEILGIILAQVLTGGEIGPNELCQYLLVSRSWHKAIIQNAHDLHIASESQDDLGEKEYVLKHVAPLTVSLHIKQDAIPAYELLQQASFSSLKFLNLDFESHLDDADRATVLNSLATVQSTLTHLNIMMDYYDWDASPAYSIGDLLSTFPRLISMTCCNIDSRINAAPTICSSLRELKLAHFQYSFESDTIDDLTKRLPLLEILCFHPCDDMVALPLIQSNCPKLKFIVYNDCGSRVGYMKRITYMGVSQETNTGEDDGVQLLKIDQGCEEHLLHGSIRDVIESITRNSRSLQAIYLRYKSGADINDHYSMYANLTFNHLTSYTHEIFCDEDMILAMGLIGRSRHLKIVELHKGRPEYHEDDYYTYSSHVHDDLSQVFTIMSELPHLEVADVRIKGDNANTGVEQFLAYHSTMYSKLRQLYIPKCFSFSIKALDWVTQLSRLEHLIINPALEESIVCKFEAVRCFLEKLAKRCPLLQNLKLYDIHHHHLHGLTLFPNLRSLWLKMHLPDESKLLVLMRSPKLEYLDVQTRSTRGMIDRSVENTLKSRMVVNII